MSYVPRDPVDWPLSVAAVLIGLVLLAWPYLVRAYRARTPEDVARRYRDSHGRQ